MTHHPTAKPHHPLAIHRRPAVQRLFVSDFLRHNSIFFVGSLTVAVLNYLYYPVLGRLLPPAGFGEVQALVSVFMQAAIFLGVVTNVAVNVVANERDTARASRVVLELERLATFITLVVMAGALIFVRQLAAFLQFNHTLPFFLLAASLVIGAPQALSTAYLRGRSAFGRVSISGAIGAAAKLAASTALVLAGFGTAGAIGGLVIAQIIGLTYTRLAARRLGLSRHGRLWRRPDLALIWPQLPYAGLVLVVSLVITVLFSLDTIVAKHYFTADVAGAYAGVSTIARIIFFLTASISAVLLSSAKLEASPRANRHLLLRSFILQLVLGGGVLLVFTLDPRLIIHLLIGSRYLAYAHLLPLLGLALFLLAALNLMFAYDLALRRTSAAVVAIVGAALMYILLQTHHDTPDALVQSLLLGSIGMVILRAADAAYRKLRQTA